MVKNNIKEEFSRINQEVINTNGYFGVNSRIDNEFNDKYKSSSFFFKEIIENGILKILSEEFNCDLKLTFGTEFLFNLFHQLNEETITNSYGIGSFNRVSVYTIMIEFNGKVVEVPFEDDLEIDVRLYYKDGITNSSFLESFFNLSEALEITVLSVKVFTVYTTEFFAEKFYNKIKKALFSSIVAE